MDKEQIRSKHKEQLSTAIGLLAIAIGLSAVFYNWIDAEIELESCRVGLKAGEALVENCGVDCGNDLQLLEERNQHLAGMLHTCEDHADLYKKSYFRNDWKTTPAETKKAIRDIICEDSR